ncbi:N-acetyltransferase [Streptomyces chartreusis]|uniref:hypothetical protein n=1 Tax=Streptomyces chartreusis TaxID=1969 RepID=UPI00365B5B8F
MTSARIVFGLGEHEEAARALLRTEWALADLPSCVNEPRFWTMTCPDFSGLAGLAVVTNGFKGPQAADLPRPYQPVLEYLVVDRQARGKMLGRRFARRVLEEACEGSAAVILEVENRRPDAVRFWTKHLECTMVPDYAQTPGKTIRLSWSPPDR